MAISAAFDALRSNVEITQLQQSTVADRQRQVRDAVARHLVVSDSFITGSYRRHTMIGPLASSDVDIVVVLDPTYYAANGQAALLDRVRRALLQTYTRTPKISRNGQAVTITFSDFLVDVVPAFNRQGGGYLIPSTTERRWISTDPKTHERFISLANASHGKRLVPLIKMIKAWNRGIGSPFKSFYLELLVEQVLRGVAITDFPSGCRYVFDKGRDAIRYMIYDPSGLSPDQVSGLATGTVADAISRFETAHARACKAETFARQARAPDAISEWRKVFRDYFPAYR